MLPNVLPSIGTLNAPWSRGRVVSDAGVMPIGGVGATTGGSRGWVTRDSRLNCKYPLHSTMRNVHRGMQLTMGKIHRNMASPGCFLFSVRSRGSPAMVAYMDAKSVNALLALHWEIAKYQVEESTLKGTSDLKTEYGEYISGKNLGGQNFDKFLEFLEEGSYVSHWLKYVGSGAVDYQSVAEGRRSFDLDKAKAFDSADPTWSLLMCTMAGARHLVRPHGLYAWQGSRTGAQLRYPQELDMDVVNFAQMACDLVGWAGWMDDVCCFYSRAFGQPLRVSFGVDPSGSFDSYGCIRQMELLLEQKLGGRVDKELSRSGNLESEKTVYDSLKRDRDIHYKEILKSGDATPFRISRTGAVMRILDRRGSRMSVEKSMELMGIPPTKEGSEPRKELDIEEIGRMVASARKREVMVYAV